MQCMCEPDGGTHATHKSAMTVWSERWKETDRQWKENECVHVPSTGTYKVEDATCRGKVQPQRNYSAIQLYMKQKTVLAAAGVSFLEMVK